MGGVEAIERANMALRLTRAAGLPTELARAHAARAVATVGATELDGVHADLQDALKEGLTDGALAAEVFCALVVGDVQGAISAVQRLKTMTDEADGFKWRLLVAQWWLDERLEPTAASIAAGVQWLDDVGAVAERWRNVLRERRAKGQILAW
jgi:hypothetical protein